MLVEGRNQEQEFECQKVFRASMSNHVHFSSPISEVSFPNSLPFPPPNRELSHSAPGHQTPPNSRDHLDEGDGRQLSMPKGAGLQPAQRSRPFAPAGRRVVEVGSTGRVVFASDWKMYRPEIEVHYSPPR